jgi:hypothetical protein
VRARQSVLADAVAEHLDAHRGGHLPQRHRDGISAARDAALSLTITAAGMSVSSLRIPLWKRAKHVNFARVVRSFAPKVAMDGKDAARNPFALKFAVELGLE